MIPLNDQRSATMNRISFTLDPVPPFRLDLTVWTLRRRLDNAIDCWDGRTYRRLLSLPNGTVDIEVTQITSPDIPRLQVIAEGHHLDNTSKSEVESVLNKLLGLQIDLTQFVRFSARQKRLGQLVRRFQGMKPPRFHTLFETLVNAIACQQVTLTLGIRLLNRLTENYGPVFQRADTIVHAFPRPDELARLQVADLRQLGFSRQKCLALIEMAQAMSEGRSNLEELAELPDAVAVERLCKLRGVGRWTAEYTLLRGLGRTNVFPGDDVGARKNLQHWLQLNETLDYESVQHSLSRWQRYGGLIYFHLLLDRLELAGYLQAEATQICPGQSVV